eukprot:TRINITY_DN995_c0_g1_i1.p3 TRINITY_DN995_c0_g1~~TRINITY_DN995_c0_g1_i1.p3  ORF type:complete len:129 (+),score=42.93 TRINITY_DN995_c0_g1_i1:62-448(+)
MAYYVPAPLPYPASLYTPVQPVLPVPSVTYPYLPAGAGLWPEPAAGGHKSISLEKELRDRGLHASANAVANGEAIDPLQAFNIERANVEMTSGSPHRFRTGAYAAHLDHEARLPVDQQSPRRALAHPL